MGFSQAYRAFVAGHPDATVWHDADFLECLAKADHWQGFLVNEGDTCIGVLPAYLKPTKLGVSLTMPPLVRYMFPLVSPSLSKAKRNEALQALVNQAKAASAKLDFYWPPTLLEAANSIKAVNLLERITYLGDTTGSADDLLGRANKSTRRRLRRAMEFFTVTRGPLAEDALTMLRAPFEKQGIPTPYNEQVLQRAFDVLFEKQMATCHRVLAPDGTLAAAAISLYDEQRLYLLVVGSRADLANANAGSLANFDMLRLSNELGLPQADFLGSMLPGPAENRRQLGGRPLSYPHLFADANLLTKSLRSWRNR